MGGPGGQRREVRSKSKGGRATQRPPPPPAHVTRRAWTRMGRGAVAGRTRTLHPTCRDDSPTQKLPSTRRHPGREQRHWSVRTPRAPPPRAPRCAGARCPPSPRATRPRRPLPGSRDPAGTPTTPTSRRPRQPRRSRAPSRLWGARVGCGSRNPPHTCTAGAGPRRPRSDRRREDGALPAAGTAARAALACLATVRPWSEGQARQHSAGKGR